MQGSRIHIGLGDAIKVELPVILAEARRKFIFLRYADIRVDISEMQSAGAESGMMKSSGRDYSLELYVRAIAGSAITASGSYGVSLGPADLGRFFEIAREAVATAYERAVYSAMNKVERRVSYGALGEMLHSTELAPVPPVHDTYVVPAEIIPHEVPLVRLEEAVRSVSGEIKARYKKVVMNAIGIGAWTEREIVATTEGTLVDQTFPFVECFAYVQAVSGKIVQPHYDVLAHQGGFEIVEWGVNEEFVKFPNLMDFSLDLAAEASMLATAPKCPTTDRPVVVLTDPHYNTLLSHEIAGHPMELDRGLKMETAYAGRTWLLSGLDENMIGKRIGSELLSAYSDPLLPGYGHYRYDHEGTPARRVTHIENGIFRGFMNSRQTSAILGDVPNGHYKANGGQVMPLIRMSNTVFAQGTSNPADMIAEVEHGYYISGHRIPSIAESRENFRISSRKVYEIRDGKLGEMYRDGGIMADSRDFFMNVDAVGNDFRLYPIASCGKGQPMQVKRLGNGGPTIRSRAWLVGGE